MSEASKEKRQCDRSNLFFLGLTAQRSSRKEEKEFLDYAESSSFDVPPLVKLEYDTSGTFF